MNWAVYGVSHDLYSGAPLDGPDPEPETQEGPEEQPEPEPRASFVAQLDEWVAQAQALIGGLPDDLQAQRKAGAAPLLTAKEIIHRVAHLAATAESVRANASLASERNEHRVKCGGLLAKCFSEASDIVGSLTDPISDDLMLAASPAPAFHSALQLVQCDQDLRHTRDRLLSEIDAWNRSRSLTSIEKFCESVNAFLAKHGDDRILGTARDAVGRVPQEDAAVWIQSLVKSGDDNALYLAWTILRTQPEAVLLAPPSLLNRFPEACDAQTIAGVLVGMLGHIPALIRVTNTQLLHAYDPTTISNAIEALSNLLSQSRLGLTLAATRKGKSPQVAVAALNGIASALLQLPTPDTKTDLLGPLIELVLHPSQELDVRTHRVVVLCLGLSAPSRKVDDALRRLSRGWFSYARPVRRLAGALLQIRRLMS